MGGYSPFILTMIQQLIRQTLPTSFIVEHLNKYQFFYSQPLKNEKLNNITGEHYKNNPLQIDIIGNEFIIVDGRHRLFMAICVYGLKELEIEFMRCDK